MNTRTRHRTRSLVLEKRILISSGVLFVLFALLYTYFLTFSIALVVEREELVHKTRTLSQKVATLEQQYLLTSNGVTEQYAFQNGYVAVSHRTFVERGTLTLGNAR